jgi:RNA polymerase sigma factor (TIGR02999 family)
LYAELREIAHRHRAVRDDASTLPTTAIVHEAYLKLVDQSRAAWTDRAHFLSLAAVAMRHILADRAKARIAVKRGGPQRPVTLDDDACADDADPHSLLELDEALDRLAAIDARLARVVECRFFGGMSVEETAEALNISPATVKRDWAIARAWLNRELQS